MMVTCHYQDEPGCKGICLRVIDVNRPIDMQIWKVCDEQRGLSCPHRGWDREARDRVVRSRIALLGGCHFCGSVHDTVREAMECAVERRLSDLSDPIPTPLPEGTEESLVPVAFPRFVKEMAWRRIRKMVMSRDGGRCTECGRDLNGLPSWYGEVHHIVPRAFGGSDRPENLRTLCIECHGRYTDEMLRPGIEGPVKKCVWRGHGNIQMTMTDDD
jgi:hypothetical protein